MSRQDLARKAEKSAAKIAKIEPMEPETMDYGAIKDELLMRLHDAALIYGANLTFNSATAFEKAQRAVIEGDLHEGFKAAEQYIKELPNFENAERTKALWLELLRRKDDPAYGSLAKFGIIEKASGKYWCAGFSWSADPLLALRFASKTAAKAEFSDIHDSLGHPAKLEVVEITAPSSALVKVEQFDLIETEVVDEFGMSQSDVERLTQLEFAIDKGRTLIGDSLREIRDSQLYKQYGTFEDYCHEKWGFSRSRAYQLMGEAAVVHNLLTSGVEPDALPQNEGQTRALAAVPVEKQAEVWTQAQAEGKPTAAKIKAIATALTPSPSPSGGEGGKSGLANFYPSADSSHLAADITDGLNQQLRSGKNPIPDGFVEFNGSVISIKEAKALQKAINKALSGSVQDDDDDWDKNLWETPDNIANAIANLLCDGLSICEPVAGTGQIARAIVSHFEEKGWEYELTAIEILKDRAAKLEDNRYFSIDADFLEFDFGSEKFDVVVTNPPFDKGLDILKKSLSLLNISGRCLFLLPIAYFQTQERAKQFAGMGAYIHRVYPIVGRVAYLKNGIPESGRQCEDAVFDIRNGKSLNGVEFIWQ